MTNPTAHSNDSSNVLARLLSGFSFESNTIQCYACLNRQYQLAKYRTCGGAPQSWNWIFKRLFQVREKKESRKHLHAVNYTDANIGERKKTLHPISVSVSNRAQSRRSVNWHFNFVKRDEAGEQPCGCDSFSLRCDGFVSVVVLYIFCVCLCLYFCTRDWYNRMKTMPWALL